MDGKRSPLAIMIAMRAKKPGDKPDSEAPTGDDEGGEDKGAEHEAPPEERLAACEDLIDAFKNRDAEAVDRALAHWCEMYRGEEESEGEEGGKKY